MAKRGLGRGLDALIPREEVAEIPIKEENKEYKMMNIAFIEPNKEQPRKKFDEEELSALSQSIKEYGIIQPITVKNEGNGFFGIIAGERRWRAAKMAGLKEVPVRIVNFTPKEEIVIALVENLQRSDLNPIEEARGYKKLMEDYSLTKEEVSAKVGKSRSAVANSLRYLALPDKVLAFLEEKKITAGHGKAILLVRDGDKRVCLAEKIIKDDLSVREAEALAQQMNEEKTEKKEKNKIKKSPEIMDLERTLSENWGTKVCLSSKRRGGKIEIEYYDAEQLETIIDYLKSYKKH